MIYSNGVTIAAAVVALVGLFALAYEPDIQIVAESSPQTRPEARDQATGATEGPTPATLPAAESIGQAAPLMTQKNTRFLFDLVQHTPEEIAALLKTAEQKISIARARAQDIDIAFVLHGPDIKVFTKSNYAIYGDIIDTAARLDAYGVIDFKVCEFSAQQQGITRDDIPTFIEFVPFGPAEIDSLEQQGYSRL